MSKVLETVTANPTNWEAAVLGRVAAKLSIIGADRLEEIEQAIESELPRPAKTRRRKRAQLPHPLPAGKTCALRLQAVLGRLLGKVIFLGADFTARLEAALDPAVEVQNPADDCVVDSLRYTPLAKIA